MPPSTLRPELSEKYPGAEPLPGYRLIAPLGKGGFGEVWRCEAPGGLQKAIKFVAADGERFRQELAAFEKIRSIRHPFLLGLDRAELAGGELVMVMELADCQFMDRFRSCKNDGLPGIPRDELVGYLEEAAESLDMIGTRYGLQHLDVKPENLFLVAGHAKVGDYGLVRKARKVKVEENNGFTPRYTPPEVLMGHVDTRSDQYSLALVYVEMLCGTFPFPGQTAQQLMIQHLQKAPDLSGIGPDDQAIVARALSKEPRERFSSCLEFVKSLASVTSEAGKALPLPTPANCCTNTPLPESIPTLLNHMGHRGPAGQQEPPISRDGEKPLHPSETIANNRRPAGARRSMRIENLQRCEPEPSDPFAGLLHVMPVSVFNGATIRGSIAPTLSSNEYVDHLVQAASESAARMRDEDSKLEGVLSARFLCTLPTTMVPYKLDILRETWNLTIVHPDFSRIVLRKEYASEPRKPGKSEFLSPGTQKPAGIEIVIQLPVPPSAEFTIRGTVTGVVEERLIGKAHKDLAAIVAQVQKQLQNVDERRVHTRYPTDFPIRIYPLYPDGIVGLPMGGRCKDISLSGARLMTASPIRTERAYLEFHDIPSVNGYAVYMRVVRTTQDLETQATITAGRFTSRT